MNGIDPSPRLRAYRPQPAANPNTTCPSCTPPHADERLIAFTDHFKVILHPNQCGLGNVIIASRRHVARICDFNAKESADFMSLFGQFEPALERAFGAELVNLYYQRNWAYRSQDPDPPFQDGRPNPHVHFHVVPRYSRPVAFAGQTWSDATFGEPFVWGRRTVPPEVQMAIIEQIRGQLELTYEPRCD